MPFHGLNPQVANAERQNQHWKSLPRKTTIFNSSMTCKKGQVSKTERAQACVGDAALKLLVTHQCMQQNLSAQAMSKISSEVGSNRVLGV